VGLEEFREATRAGTIRWPVVDDEKSRVERIAGQHQARLAVVDGDVLIIMPGNRNHREGAIPKIERPDAVRPLVDREASLNRLLSWWQNRCRRAARELRVSRGMIAMCVGVCNDEVVRRGRARRAALEAHPPCCAWRALPRDDGAPVSMSNERSDPSNRYMNGASKLEYLL
jgi:hypothetical protein